jgi:hypothetical protein
MTTSITKNQEVSQVLAVASEPEATKKASNTPRKPHVAPVRGKSGRKANSSKKRTKAPKKATKIKADGARQGTKTEKALDLLKRADGATLKEIMKATGWHAHSVRGFISGTLGKKMGLKIESTKREDGERVYSLAK